MLEIYRRPDVKKNWLVTVAIGEKYLANFEKFALPSWKKYCDRHGLGIVAVAEQLLAQDNPYWKKPNWQKLLVPKLLVSELADKKFEINEKFQGEQRLIDFFEENEELSNFLYEDFQKLTNAL